MNERIKALRLALGLSQDEFGRRLGVTRGAITNIELNKVEPKPLFVNLICREFNVSLEWLETGEGEMFRSVSVNTELSQLVGELLRDKPGSFKQRVIAALLRCNDDEWGVFRRVVSEIENDLKDEKGY